MDDQWEIPGLLSAPTWAQHRLWRGVQRRTPNECWPWKRARNAKGYGHASMEGAKAIAHRAAYRLAKGEIPAGMIVRHTCDHPACCNPDHLVVGTHADNRADAIERGRTTAGQATCKNGHAYDAANTLWRLNGNRRRVRKCRTCHLAQQTAHRRKQKAAAHAMRERAAKKATAAALRKQARQKAKG